MSIVNDIRVKTETYAGEGELEFIESEIRFNILKKSNHVVAGFLFGIIGRMVAEAMSSGNGKVLLSFTPAEVSTVKYSAGEGSYVYYFYIKGNPAPCEITIETNTYLNKMIKTHFSEKLMEIKAR